MRALFILALLCLATLAFCREDDERDFKERELDEDSMDFEENEVDEVERKDPRPKPHHGPRSRRNRSRNRRNRHQRRSSSRRSSTSKPSNYDSQGRRCQIVRGRLVNCCRVRKDFESMNHVEQKRSVQSYITVSTTEPYKTKYQKLIKLHEKNFATRIHMKEEFLPWHRWFLLQIENLMREVDPMATIPYWDWSVWSHDPWDNKKMWSPIHGYGGNGRKSDECVTTGPFRAGKWKTVSGTCLKRQFNGNPPDADQIAIALREPTHAKFDLMLRVNLHEGMHCFINGTMCSGKSAEAPEFFLHHGFIDKIWADRQKQGTAQKFAYFHTVKPKMVGVNYYPKDFVDNDKLPGGVRVCYDDPSANGALKIRKFLKSLSFKKLESLHRLAFSHTPNSAENLFHNRHSERVMARELENEAMKGINQKRGSSIFAKALTSLEKIEGFKVPALEHLKGDAKEQEIDEDSGEEVDMEEDELNPEEDEGDQEDDRIEGDEYEVERVEEDLM